MPSTDEYAELCTQQGSTLLDSANKFSGFVQPETSDDHDVLRVSGPFKHLTAFHADVSDGRCYRVDVETDNLSSADLVAHEAAITAADNGELASFLKRGVFELLGRQHASSRAISCTWVRKWKRLQDGSRKIKSRLCARGFLDPQLGSLTKHSSTATRLSQKLLLSKAALEGWPVESWDVGSAFLQGISFADLDVICAKLGTTKPHANRNVLVEVPGNVWLRFHLHESGFLPEGVLPQQAARRYVLRLLKGMYGLNDAPQLWQLSLRYHLQIEMKATPSHHDDCFFSWRDPETGRCTGVATAHVWTTRTTRRHNTCWILGGRFSRNVSEPWLSPKPPCSRRHHG